MAAETTKSLRRMLRRLGERLLADGVIDEEQLRQGLERQRQTGQFLGETLFALGYVSSNQIGAYLEEVTGFPFVDLAESSVDLDVARRLPEEYARRRHVLPFREREREIDVAMIDPLNLTVVDDLRSRLGKPIVPHLAFANDIEDAIKRTFDVAHKALSVLQEISGPAQEVEVTVEQLLGQAEDAPVVRLVSGIVQGAISASASDIHIEPSEKTVRVRYRMDGLLYEQMTIPPSYLAATISRLKIMSNLDIAERRRPQDGRFSASDPGGKSYDVRLSIMPTIYGEKAVMRLLAKSSPFSTLDKLGFFPEQKALFEKFIHRPHGIILVTGPTGSGKSTTLYAGLQSINDPHLNINTIEDPVEYKLHGINQVQVNNKINVTFANGLRTLVRQDPDVILVGEIRDSETAEIAIQAALTGHLVLSTLHTNDAPGALVRLQNMGVEPFLISSAVVGVVGQRLLRTICPSCKTLVQPTLAEEEAFAATGHKGKLPLVATGKGCKRCGGRGVRGRTSVYEIMPMSDPLRNLVLKGASGAQLKAHALEEGMSSMLESGWRKVMDHVVPVSEVFRVLAQEE
jgi:type IV pilus assembly protein PilB